MAALDVDRRTLMFDGDLAEHPVATDTRIFLGSLVSLNASGFAIPTDATTPSQRFVGVSQQHADNRDVIKPSARQAAVDCRRTGVHRLDVTGGPITEADVGALVFATDDHTVSLTDTGGLLIVGEIGKFSGALVADVDISQAVGTAAAVALHALGGTNHTPSTLAELNALISDATLSETSPPNRTLFMESPGSAENDPSFKTPVALTVASLETVLRGSAGPSVTWEVRFGPDRSAAGTLCGGATTTSTTTGDSITPSTSAIPAGSHVWLVTTAQSGTVNSIAVTVVLA